MQPPFGTSVFFTRSAFLFDLDGTLIDSEGLHFRSTKTVLASRGIALLPEQFERYVGWDEHACWHDLATRFEFDGTPKQLTDERTLCMEALLKHSSVAVMRGADQLLVWARERAVPMAIASSLPAAQIDLLLDAAGLSRFFTVRVSGCDHVPRGKPAPDVYQLAASRLGVDAAACVAFEDSETGLKSARAAGCFVVAVGTYLQTMPAPDADARYKTFVEALAAIQD